MEILALTKDELPQRMHQPIPEQGSWLRQVVIGHFGYYAVPGVYTAFIETSIECH
jgi:hypothetical protein